MTTLCYFNCANDTIGEPVSDYDKGGYGCALEGLLGLLGCDDKAAQYVTDDAKETPPLLTGWLVVSDGEDDDSIYSDGKLMATVQKKEAWWSSRGFWQATATLHDGRVLSSKGANLELSYDSWG
jgi:hypothetical protein